MNKYHKKVQKNKKNIISKVSRRANFIARGFETQSMIGVLGKISSLKNLQDALIKSDLYSESEVNDLVPLDPHRIIDAINRADYFYPHSHPAIHQAAKDVISEVKQKIYNLRDKICNLKSALKPHYPLVVAGAGPLASFYIEVASFLENCKIGSDTTLIFKDQVNLGTFNLESDLHLLQPGRLRKEEHQLFNLPLPSVLVELGVLKTTATWLTGKVGLDLTPEGKIKVFNQHLPQQEFSSDCFVMSLGLGESILAIQGKQDDVSSISKITADGGFALRKMLQEKKGQELSINIIGSGGAVASAIHVINRLISEIRITEPKQIVKVNLWTKLSKTTIKQNQMLTSHFAWLQNELMDMTLVVPNPDLILTSEPVQVGSFTITHAADKKCQLEGKLFHYDNEIHTPFIDERDQFCLYSLKEQNIRKEFIEKNSVAVNCAGQANFLAAIELNNILSKSKEYNLSITPVLLGDEEGTHSLVLELRTDLSHLTIKPCSRLILGTTQAIGILRAWKKYPELGIGQPQSELEPYLLALQYGHTKSSEIRHLYAYCNLEFRANHFILTGGFSFTKPEGKDFVINLAMPGAVGVCHSRKVKVLKSAYLKNANP